MSKIKKNIIKFSIRVNNNTFPAKFSVDIGRKTIVHSIKPTLNTKDADKATLTIFFPQNERDDLVMESSGGFYERLWKDEDWESVGYKALREVDPEQKWDFDEKKLKDDKFKCDKMVYLPMGDAVFDNFHPYHLYQSVFTLPLTLNKLK